MKQWSLAAAFAIVTGLSGCQSADSPEESSASAVQPLPCEEQGSSDEDCLALKLPKKLGCAEASIALAIERGCKREDPNDDDDYDVCCSREVIGMEAEDGAAPFSLSDAASHATGRDAGRADAAKPNTQGDDPCSSYGASCQECTPTRGIGCGWCDGLCRQGTSAGPAMGSCEKNTWIWNSGDCGGGTGGGSSGSHGGCKSNSDCGRCGRCDSLTGSCHIRVSCS